MRAWWKPSHGRSLQQAAGVRVYIARDGACAVVAPLVVNDEGVYSEQPGQARRCDLLDEDDLGNAFIDGWCAFRREARDLRGLKQSDWPAYLASEATSIKTFDAGYLCIDCFACNASGAVVRASAPHPVEDEIELSIAFSPVLPAAEIGRRRLRLFVVARGTATGS